MSSRPVPCHEFSRAWGYFKAAAIAAPVVITTRGRPTHVLMSWLEYRYLLDEQQSILDRLDMAEASGAASHSNSASESTGHGSEDLE